MFYKYTLIFLTLLSFTSQGYSYQKPDNIPQATWDELTPYFLPENHPMKRRMDKIFHKRSVTKSRRAVEAAGFFNSKPGKYTQTIVSGHLSLEGYVVKMYLDSNTEVNAAKKFKERIVGAAAIKKVINDFALHSVVKVPQKWIYPIPQFKNSGVSPKQFVLLAEDMQPYSFDKSLSFWKKKITKRQLDAVWIVLSKVGLPDCAYAFNIPFCRDGKLAFLDTELSGLWPVDYRRMHQYLRGDKLDYWIRICQ